MVTLVAAVCFVSSAVLQADPPVDVPPNVKYKTVDDSINEKEKAEILTDLAGGPSTAAKLFGGPCIVAPGYWKALASAPNIRFTSPIHSNFKVPQPDGSEKSYTGGTIKEASDLKVLAGQFAQDIGSAPKIRKLTSTELSELWAIYPFDLQEPIFMLENDHLHLVVIFLLDSKTNQYQLNWLDEMENY